MISYIPAPDAAFSDWLNNFSTLLTATPALFGLVAGDATIVDGVTDAWNAAWALASNPGTRTSANVADKNVARINAESIVRPYAVRISLNQAVSDGNKTAIGVTVRALVPTPVPAPTTAPEIGIQSAIPLQQTLTYKEPGAAGKYKPPGVIGVEVFRSVGAVAAVDPLQASYVGTVTKSPFRQSFTSAEQGKTVTYFARWTTKSGPGGVSQSGPWSAPLVVVAM